ncbi:phosphotransferase [Nocardia aurantia]|uniref:Aminoglycoside phosphotransferase domain-containing protein n=1 Tax=Nocardia aurantia TaxID=2585199 RepID=A0A7K0DSZ7_9NOCA|nr:phosphotransferase [Nocardia aurantia]MQY28889.1 hypothetical protein [Nocardia aurantia]
MITGADLLALCRHHLDPDSRPIAEHPGHQHTVVLRAATRHGEVIVKAHRHPQRHLNEVHAYQQWTPVIADRTPRLLTKIDDPPAIIVTALPGNPLAATPLPPDRQQAAYLQAGALLAAWHTAEPADSTVDITTWLAERGDAWLQLAEDILSANDRRTIRAHLRELAQLGPVPAAPCHLDFTPRNLLYHDGIVKVLDFEHSRIDLPARDLVRLAHRYWCHRPDLEAAFLTGYGPLTGLDHEIIEHCTHFDHLTAAVRATGRSLPPADPARSRSRS